jgi:hypothetical protein
VPLREKPLCLSKIKFRSNWRLSLQNQVSGFLQKFWFVQVESFSGGEFPNFICLKIGSYFGAKNFVSNFLRFLKCEVMFL